MDTIAASDFTTWIHAQIDDSVRVQEAVREMTPLILRVGLHMADALGAGRQAFFFGNGGSAADAQHWAAELSGRFYMERRSLPATALSTNTSQVTAIANDYGFEEVFARPLASLGQPGDFAIGISTSGRSPSVVRALQVAHRNGLVTVGFTSGDGADLAADCDYMLAIPSTDVARIQEGHELCAHLLCAVVERKLFGGGS